MPITHSRILAIVLIASQLVSPAMSAKQRALPARNDTPTFSFQEEAFAQRAAAGWRNRFSSRAGAVMAREVADALAVLPDHDRALQMERFHLLDKKDINGQVRWQKDVVWNAGLERLRQDASEIEQAIPLLPPAWAEALEASPAREEALETLRSGRAILCEGFEVRWHPVQRDWRISRKPLVDWRAPQSVIRAKAPPKIVIGILVYNGWEDTRALLKQLHRQLRGPGAPVNVEVALLDNGSRVSGLQDLAGEFRDAPFGLVGFRSEENLGFDEGHNALISFALDHSLADHYLSLNPDVQLGPEFINGLLQAAESPELSVGAVAPILTSEDGSLQSNGGELPSWKNYYRTWFLGPFKDRRLQDLPPQFSVHHILGPAQWYTARALRRAGGYVPVLFAYLDEFPLGLKILRSGLLAVLTQDSTLRHRGQSSVGSHLAERLWQLDTRNRLLIAWRFRSLLSWETRIALHRHVFRRLRDALRVRIYERKTEPRYREPFRGWWLGVFDILLHRIPIPQAGSLTILYYALSGWRPDTSSRIPRLSAEPLHSA